MDGARQEPESVIETRGLRRVFKSRQRQVEAVAGVDLDVRRGEIFGFLGPNGAGKTTTLRMLATLLPPSGGTARVAGCELATQPGKIRERIGYVGQAGGADREITGRTGLDRQSRARVWDEVRRMHERGTTVFLTTHYLDEADALCDRVAIIDYGKIVAEGTPEELKRAIAGDVVTFTIAGEQQRALDLVKDQDFVRDARLPAGRRLQRLRARAARAARHVRGRRRWFQPDLGAAHGGDRAIARHAREPGGAAVRTRPAGHVLDRPAVADPHPDRAALRVEHPPGGDRRGAGAHRPDRAAHRVHRLRR